MTASDCRSARTRSALMILLLCFVIQAGRCPDVELAQKTVRENIISVIEGPDRTAPENWRVHWKLLKKQTEVSSFDFELAGGLETYTCSGWCILFFLDLNPFAHFAHPTRIFVFDSKPASDDPVHVFKPTKWWPTIREPSWRYPRSVFNTVEERWDPAQVFVLDGPAGELTSPLPPGFRLRHHALGTVSTAGSGPPPTPVDAETGCDTDALPVWAILVNGYNDPLNTFDEDVVGMYSVLKGLGVDDARMQILSPIQLQDVPNVTSASKFALESAFEVVQAQMEECTEPLQDATPHFLLFWSSHGASGALACNRADGNQDLIWATDLSKLIGNLEEVWKLAGSVLETTAVIEACESGTVGETLKGTNPGNRWIFTSAKGQGSVSCGDIDEPIAGKDDPNPADTGSETIWGYIEAYGTGSADEDFDGKISFDEAVAYAKESDVGFQESAPVVEYSCSHQTMVWTPANPGVAIRHGAWNTSVRATSSVTFSAPSSTAMATFAAPVVADVLPGETVKVEVEVSNQETFPEVGSLALRLFRNDETAAGDKWIPHYYAEDNLRTTVMIPGLATAQPRTVGYTVDIPGAFQEGDTLRFVVTLDSGQKPPVAAAGASGFDPKSEIILKVKKKNTGFCSWWKSLWD